MRSYPARAGGPGWILGAAIIAAALLGGCDRGAQPQAATEPSASVEPPGKPPRIASLVPAATDLIVGMGAGDHLVAVSNFDQELKDVPRVGDYETTDWEALKKAQPKIIVVQASEARLPYGFKENTDEMAIRRFNVHFDHLSDIYNMTAALGDAVLEPAKAAILEQSMRKKIESIDAEYHGDTPIRTLIFLDAAGEKVVGPGNFLDDLLGVAGGQNAAASLADPWPTVDREKLLSLKPNVIVFLLPDANSETEAKARGFGAGLESIPAVRDGRVYVLSDWYVQQPGSHVGELAGRLANVLHAEAQPLTHELTSETQPAAPPPPTAPETMTLPPSPQVIQGSGGGSGPTLGPIQANGWSPLPAGQRGPASAATRPGGP